MPRYFLNLNESGERLEDKDGVERANVDEVRATALAAAREIMCEEVCVGRLCLSGHIDVTDQAGVTVLTLPFRDAVAITGM